MLLVTPVNLAKAHLWTNYSIMTGNKTVIAKLFLSYKIISFADASSSKSITLR